MFFECNVFLVFWVFCLAWVRTESVAIPDHLSVMWPEAGWRGDLTRSLTRQFSVKKCWQIKIREVFKMDFKVKKIHETHDTRFVCVLYTWKRNTFYAFDVKMFHVSQNGRWTCGKALVCHIAWHLWLHIVRTWTGQNHAKIWTHDINIT